MTATTRRLLLGVAAVAGVVLAVIEARSQGPGTDFHARWIFGRWFWAGEPLYRDVPGVRGPNLYPPFAAMLFQLHALLPLEIAGGVFYFVNLALIPIAVRLALDVLDLLWPGRPRERWRLVLAVLFSAQFFLNNLNLVQVNLALFVLCLWGIRAYLRGRDVAGAGALVVATAIKLVPMFLVAWLVVRGRRRAAVAVIPLGLACLVLPIAQRGPAQGVRDLREYSHALLQGVQPGRVITSYTNQNLAAAVYRLTQPRDPAAADRRDYRLVSTSETTARALVRAVAIVCVAGFAGVLVWLRVRRVPLGAFELCAAFLLGHLLSAMTWKAHLVTLLFVYLAFLSLERTTRALWWPIVALMAVVGLTGRDLVGTELHHYIGGYSVIVWLLLLLYAGSLWLAAVSGLPRPLPSSSAAPIRPSSLP